MSRTLQERSVLEPSPTSPSGASSKISEQTIADRIFWAVMEHRLPPGTKLPENVLCETFGTSRMRIRRAFVMLAEREVVVLQSNRGAFVASPSPEEAKDVFGARRAIEPIVVKNAVERIKDSQVATLRHHVDKELAAGKSGKRHEAIRLSGRFHVRLAEFGGSPVLTRFIEELVARSSLIIGLFGSHHISLCSEDEHSALIEAIARRDADRAISLMIHHLNHIESELELTDRAELMIDIRKVLRC
jgi:DNA-binding GntR family transcriptional regulator